MLERVWRKGNPLKLLVGTQIDTATIENSVESPLKIRNKTTIWPSNPTTGHMPWGIQNWKRHVYPNIHCNTIYNSQDMAATLTDGMDAEVVVHIHNGILLSHKREHVWVSSNKVNEPWACYTERIGYEYNLVMSIHRKRRTNTIY